MKRKVILLLFLLLTWMLCIGSAKSWHVWKQDAICEDCIVLIDKKTILMNLMGCPQLQIKTKLANNKLA